jgi:hypothetical protein
VPDIAPALEAFRARRAFPGAQRQAARYELKLPVGVRNLGRAATLIAAHPLGFKEVFAPRQVNSLYFDSPRRQCFWDSVEGVSERFKMRLRWYGNTLDTSGARIEWKFRSNRVGWKDSVRLTTSLDPDAALSGTQRATVFDAVPRSLRALTATLRVPTLVVRYQRRYFATRRGDCRITLDQQVVYVPNPSTLRMALRKLPPGPTQVVEVKVALEHADLIDRALRPLPFRPSGHSKYVAGLDRFVR